MAFKLTSVNTAATLANICVFTDTAVGPNESHYMSPITGAQGLYWSGEYQVLSYIMAIVAGGYPLTTAISAYWFGDWRDMGDNWWNQTTSSESFGVNVAMSVSRKNILVPAIGAANLSFVLRT
jgi:hypothetical protein